MANSGSALKHSNLVDRSAHIFGKQLTEKHIMDILPLILSKSVKKPKNLSKQGDPSGCEFSASRHFFKTNVAQSVAELVLCSQKTRNCCHFLSTLVNLRRM